MGKSVDGRVPLPPSSVVNFSGGGTSTHSPSVRLSTVFVYGYGVRVVSNLFAQVFLLCVQI